MIFFKPFVRTAACVSLLVPLLGAGDAVAASQRHYSAGLVAGAAQAQSGSGDFTAIAMAETFCLRYPTYDLEKISAAVDEVAGRHIEPEVGSNATRWTMSGPSGRKLILVRDSRPGRLKCAFQAERVAFDVAQEWLDHVSSGFAEEVNGQRQDIRIQHDAAKGSAAVTTVKTELGPMFFGVWSTPDGGAMTTMGPLREFVEKK
ncbi:hypothetical protein NUH88_06510 [Nisaea acidiphila]|uniref:Uncharacterized protein n=1 Tax=Nisaea acidiphila TaxID=1862145 RepID=A0A9J7AVH6_9PROT|nr:hypothetical protein [Nisaea acidiphila]UUX51343.1 hypothetical protein NUH88_06510 [Nisaea acidiphila]